MASIQNNAFLARILLSVIFLLSGASKCGDISGTSSYIGSGFANVGLDLGQYVSDPSSVFTILTYISIALELGGGLALVTGGVNCGTWMLLSIIVPVTAIMHWPITPSGDMDQNQFVHLLKNIAIIGGLIAIRSAYGCGGAKAVVKDKLG